MKKQNGVSERRHAEPKAHGRFARSKRYVKPRGGPRIPHSGTAGDGTIPAACISPFQASQRQGGHNSATVVRTSVSGTPQQQTLFFSSVQCRGGVFTKSAQETRAQLARTGVLPDSTAYRKRVKAAMEEVMGKPQTIHERFVDMESKRTRKELHEAKTIVVGKRNANRFLVDDGESEGDEA